MRMAVKIDSATRANVNEWLSGEYDQATKDEIRRLEREDPEELVNAFYQKLDFGTGGLRGQMGVGCNRMNVYTVRAATQGLANYLKQECEGAISVLIGYDSRHHSKTFARECARVLSANQIKALLFEALRPLPLVSFGCRHLHCNAAIMITASHNPPEYNGYKVYWSHGAQVLPPHDTGIVREVNKITDLSQVKVAETKSQIQWIGSEIDDAYMQTVHKLQSLPEQNRRHGHQLKIVYTALHGAGITMVPKTLATWGFTSLIGVDEQNVPDGDFPTLKSPNPEDPAALEMGIQTLKANDANILIATDPDTDRMGVVVLHEGKPWRLDGNQTACLCASHLCKHLPLHAKSAFVKTIVTTELFHAITTSAGCACFDVLTGFKYIGELIDQWEAATDGFQFIFGAEESYGYLRGSHCRDKDAIIAAALISEIALDATLSGETLVDRLKKLYETHGVYREKLVSKVYTGKEGAEAIQKIMDTLRQAHPKELAGVKILLAEDYLSSTRQDLASGEKSPLTLPKSNVLLYRLEDGSKVVVRPSGTEPKIKLYCGVNQHLPTIDEAVQAADAKADALLSALQAEFP